jgi:hypothetical protein
MNGLTCVPGRNVKAIIIIIIITKVHKLCVFKSASAIYRKIDRRCSATFNANFRGQRGVV